MLRITDQYFWNFIFGLFFVLLVVMGAIILETEARIAYTELAITDFALITLATWRLIHLFVHEHTTKWLREQFYDVKKVGKGYTLEKPKFGPRRTVADLLTTPSAFGVAAAAFVIFFYLLTPYAYYITIFLAVSAVATFLQQLAAWVGWQGEKVRQEVEG